MSNHSNHFLTEEKIKEIEENPMDDLEIMKEGNIKDIKIMAYNDLVNYIDNFDELLKTPVMLLYQSESQNIGHWTCLCKSNDIIYYFDSLGKPVDEPLTWDTQKTIMKEPYLTNLINKSPYECIYNKIPYQKTSLQIATCGRHCLNWLNFHKTFNYDLDAYYEAMKHLKETCQKSYDEIVSSLINEL